MLVRRGRHFHPVELLGACAPADRGTAASPFLVSALTLGGFNVGQFRDWGLIDKMVFQAERVVRNCKRLRGGRGVCYGDRSRGGVTGLRAEV